MDVRLQDYREIEGKYDAIVSVEMIEAVGEAYWAAYFATLDRLLAPGGKVSIQTITMAHDRVLATRRSFSWIQKYIFPGGIIPSLQAIDDTLAAHTTLRVIHGVSSGRTTPGPSTCGGSASMINGRISRPRGSPGPSGGCGSSTSHTPRPASAAVTSA